MLGSLILYQGHEDTDVPTFCFLVYVIIYVSGLQALNAPRAGTPHLFCTPRSQNPPKDHNDQKNKSSILPRPSIYLLLDPKYLLLGTIYPCLRVQGGGKLQRKGHRIRSFGSTAMGFGLRVS